MQTAAEVERFWARVDRNGPIPAHAPELGPCWVWTGALAGRGYGHFYRGGRHFYAHVFAYEVTLGHACGGLYVCHRCDNPPCCNPAHLFLGTNADNQRDAVQKGRQRPPHMPGESHPMAKLTIEQVRAIRAHAGPLKVIASEFAISIGQASNIRLRKSWAHVG